MKTTIPHHWLIYAILIGVLLLFTSACQPQNPPLSDSPAATNSPLPPSPTATTLTNTPLPPSPTAVADTPSATADAPSASPTPTDEEGWIATIMAAAAPQSVQIFASPDKFWQAEVLRYECTMVEAVGGEMAYEQLLLTGTDGTVTPMAEQLQFCGGMGAAGINGLFWSPNGQYFYFDMARAGQPDGMACRYWHTGKSRLNTVTLEVETLPGKGTFTPDGLGLLLVAEPDFILWNLDEGEVGRSAHAFTDLSVQSLAFSPDGSQVAYVLRANCMPPLTANSIVGMLTLADMSHTTLLESSDPSILHLTWESNDSISLLDFTNNDFELSPTTGELKP